MEENNNLCGNTYTPEYASQEPCEQVSTDCVVYEGNLPELSLANNPNVTSIINALVSSLINLSNTSLNQNNVFKNLYLGFTSGGNHATITANAINASTQFTVSQTQIYFFNIVIDNFFYVYSFRDIGKGTYGVGGTQIDSTNLQVISRRNLNIQTITDETSTDTFALGNLGSSPVEDGVNGLNPAVTIQPLSGGFTIFTATIDGESLTYLFTGDSGLTGSGQQQTASDDFELLTTIAPESLTPATATPPASGTFSIDLSNYLGTDYSGSTTSLTSINIASGSVQGGFARVKGNWSTQPTFTGATEADTSNFTGDTVIYLYVEKWADGVVYWYANN